MQKDIDKSSSSNNTNEKWGCMAPTHIIWQINTLKDLAEKFILKRFTALGYEGLFPSHGGILAMLFTAGGRLKMKEISDRLDRTKSTVSELVNKLENMGLVRRHECTVDGRVCYVNITHKGRDFEKELADLARELNESLYKGFSETEKEAAESLIVRMMKNLAE
ncbi:MAG: MarR family transcriptional regulator [Spirochaetota bacterium]